METTMDAVCAAVTGMTVAQLLRHMARLSAREDATEWVQVLPTDMPAAEAWAQCERADWMLWLAARAEVDRKLVVLVACDCARTALPIWTKRYPDDGRALAAIETAERWTRGEATIEDVRAARRDAAAADAAADADAAAAAAAAADAAAAAYAARRATRASMLRQCADLTRARITWETVERALMAQDGGAL